MSHFRKKKEKCKFYLPPKGVLESNNSDDPLPYYYHPLVGFLYRQRIGRALSLLSPPYESILELGYGSGVLIPTLTSFSKDVFGVDVGSDPVKVSSNLNKIGVRANLFCENLFNFRGSARGFDLIVAISVFEHIVDLSKILDKAFNLLRPGGHLLVGMPRVDCLMEAGFRLIGYRGIYKHHVNTYEKFIEISKNRFNLNKFDALPSWLPKSMGIYFNMLFSKNKN